MGSNRGVVKVGSEHAESLARFFRQVWDPSSSAESVTRALRERAETNYVTPGTPPPAFIFVRDGVTLGYVSTIPARFLIGGTERTGHWLQGLSVLPEYQRGPVGFSLVKEAADSLDLLGALVVQEPARRLFGALGFTDVAVPPNFVWPLRGFRAGHRLSSEAIHRQLPWKGGRPILAVARRARLLGAGGAVGRALLRLRRARASLGRRSAERAGTGIRTHTGWAEWDPHVPAHLWARRTESPYHGLVRDGAYIQWRYRTRDSEYVPIWAGNDEGPLALVMLRRPTLQKGGRFRNLRLAWLTELLVDPTDGRSVDAGGRLLRMAERVAATDDGDLLVSSFSGRHEEAIMRANGHLALGGSMHLLMRDPRRIANQEDPLDHVEWIVTRGDAASDSTT